MNFSPAKCYKDLMVEFLDMAVGGMSCFPGFEDYHREYLVDYDIEYLEELVRKFSKKGHTYFAFMAGMVYSTCMDNWSDILDKDEDLSEEENDEFIDAANAGLTSFMTLLGIEDFSMEEAFDMFDLDEEECDCDCDGDCECCGHDREDEDDEYDCTYSCEHHNCDECDKEITTDK